MTGRDDGPAISFKVLRRGTVVRTSDGVEIGKVRRVLELDRENLFDGIEVDTADRRIFVDAPEVDHIAERAVTLSIDAAEVAALPDAQSRLKARVEMAPSVRRAKRFGRKMKDRWEKR
ncbi:hypothetical protein GKE82_12060 [Conexibacter sp. W3-3-2]|uniref:DUF2171 domain-containing protein n=1 Tax=Paraconexibacter algicola TaxID=2133960 RepID=A0A2T4UHK7_9ACTN|nr:MULTISPECIES: hypothetical protein [Solirubrobacterales]MTD45004.1 hypothetical protein [Conexibacter sp. W3-3-2]PTL58707.1 hypothetical protein C7Y72_03100 [Paraconexibacter algicola]